MKPEVLTPVFLSSPAIINYDYSGHMKNDQMIALP
jgi:hypothetical protein